MNSNKFRGGWWSAVGGKEKEENCITNGKKSFFWFIKLQSTGMEKGRNKLKTFPGTGGWKKKKNVMEWKKLENCI